MRCQRFTSLGVISARTLIALFAKIDLSWGRKRGRCPVIIFITPIASFLGWFNTILALFVGRSCLLMAVSTGARRITRTVRGEGIPFLSCGLSARRTPVQTTTRRQEGVGRAAAAPPAAQQARTIRRMKGTLKWITPDGLLIIDGVNSSVVLALLLCSFTFSIKR